MEPSDFKTQVLFHTPVPETGATPDIADTLAARYEVLDNLGEGGMGLVYRVRDRETSEILALKLLRPEIAGNPAMMERFKDEIRLARKITHKNVSRIYDFNRIDDLVYLTMEFVDGESLRTYLQRVNKLSPERVIDLARQIAAGLGEAHAQGVVHRDLKPENVILARDGLVKLMDFGIARALGSDSAGGQAVIGTPGYMAPELSQGKAVDQRADLYALGLILYECLTGRRAFAAATPMDVALKQIKERPVPPRKFLSTTPPHLEAIVLRCLEKEPIKRFTSAAELLRALAQPVAPPKRARPWRRAGFMLTFGLLTVVIVYQFVKQPETSTASTHSVAKSGPTPNQKQVPDELVKLFESANRGDATAQERVGQMYLEGPEQSRDERKAFLWVRRAAQRGNLRAQFMLAQMYERGQGVPRDVVEAYVWYSKASDAGVKTAKRELERLKKEVSPSVITTAERRAARRQ